MPEKKLLKPQVSIDKPAATRTAAPAIVVNGNLTPRINVNPLKPGESKIPAISAKFQFTVPKLGTEIRSQILDGDFIDITKPVISNTVLQDYELSHVATLRPEIIAATELYPIYPDAAATGENLTKVGKLISFQYQSQQLKSEILKQLVGAVSDNLAATGTTNSNLLDAFDARYNSVNVAKSELDLIGNVQNTIRGLLDFRNILKQTVTLPNVASGVETSKFGIVQPTIPRVIGAKQLLQSITGYNDSQFDSFTNTKIFMTMCSDLEQAFTDGVYGNLATEIDQNRVGDLHPTNIDLTHTTDSKIDVNVLNQPYGVAGKVLMTDSSKFNRFQQTLPKDYYQKLTILLNFITKELLYSSYLNSLGSISNIATSGNFFNSVFGKPGKTIFDLVSGDKSMVTVASLQDTGRNAAVLPFENVYIENNTGNSQLAKKYIPGKRYFVDSIIDGVTTNSPDLNTKPLVDYNTRSQAIFDDTINILNEIKTIRSSYFLYNASGTYKYLLSQLDASTAGLQFNNRVVKEQAISVALLRGASEDSVLKLMLFQYMLYVGIYLRKNAQNQNQYVIFDSVANELISSQNLSYLQSPYYGTSAVTMINGRKIQNVTFENITKSQNSIMAEHLKAFATNIATYVVRKQLSNRRPGPLNPNEILVSTLQDVIVDFLISPTKNALFVPKGTMFYDFFDFIQSLDSVTSIGFFSNSGGTKFRGVTATNLTYLIYEAYISMSNIFGYCGFTLSRNATSSTINNQPSVTINCNWYKHGLSREKIQLLIGRNTGVNEKIETTTSNSNDNKLFNRLNNLLGAGSQTITTVDSLQILASQQTNNFMVGGNTQQAGKRGEITTNQFVTFQFSIVPPTVFPDASRTPGVLSDIYLLYGDKIQDGIQFLPKNGAKVYEIFNKLWNEDWYYPSMINGFLSLVNTNINKGIKNNIAMIVNPNTLPTIRGTKLRPEVENLRIFDQAFTDYSVLRGYTTPSGIPSKNDLESFFSRLAPSQLKLQLLLQLFKEASFLPVGSPNSTRTRVLSIGLPNGMIESMNDRKLLSSINSKTVGRKFFTTQQGFESDIVKINVYRKDLRFDGLIFKPKSYYFDGSLFVNESSITALQATLTANSITNPNNLTFDELVNKTTFFDYDNASAFQPKNVVSVDSTLATNFNNGNYSTTNYQYGINLPNNVRFEILRNTFESFLLQYYISFVTGMVIDEKAFSTAKDDGSPNSPSSIALGNTFVRETLNYLKSVGEPIKGTSIQEALNSPISKQAVLLLELVQSAVTVIDPGVIYSRLANNPLAFDRVFHVVETADGYEIDVAKTKLTKDGLNLLSSDKFVESLVRLGDSYFLPFTGMSDVALSDYFVDIEIAEF